MVAASIEPREISVTIKLIIPASMDAMDVVTVLEPLAIVPNNTMVIGANILRIVQLELSDARYDLAWSHKLINFLGRYMCN
jgi:hypothetical protein